MNKRLKGHAPSKVTGQSSVSSTESPWWDSVATEIISQHEMIGKILTIEELTKIVPCYPGGQRPRSRTVARRLHRILELVSRGPNRSRGNGATYRIISDFRAALVGRQDVDDETVTPAIDWLQDAVERMTHSK